MYWYQRSRLAWQLERSRAMVGRLWMIRSYYLHTYLLYLCASATAAEDDRVNNGCAGGCRRKGCRAWLADGENVGAVFPNR